VNGVHQPKCTGAVVINKRARTQTINKATQKSFQSETIDPLNFKLAGVVRPVSICRHDRDSRRSTNSASTQRQNRLLLLCCICHFAVQVYHYWPFMADDAFLSLRYSERLMNGKGLTWSDGQRVEGYPNLLWVLSLGKLHIDLVPAA
jgi:hypothetical protein